MDNNIRSVVDQSIPKKKFRGTYHYLIGEIENTPKVLEIKDYLKKLAQAKERRKFALSFSK